MMLPPSPPAAPFFFSSFFFLSFPIILQHWAEAFLCFSQPSTRNPSIYFSLFFFLLPSSPLLVCASPPLSTWRWWQQQQKKASQLNGEANRRRRSRNISEGKKASLSSQSREKSCPRLIFNHTRLAFYHTMDISLDSFLCFPFFLLHSFSITHTLELCLISHLIITWCYTLWNRMCVMWWRWLSGKSDYIYISFDSPFNIPTCDTLLNSDWKLPIKLNWTFLLLPFMALELAHSVLGDVAQVDMPRVKWWINSRVLIIYPLAVGTVWSGINSQYEFNVACRI